MRGHHVLRRKMSQSPGRERLHCQAITPGVVILKELSQWSLPDQLIERCQEKHRESDSSSSQLYRESRNLLSQTERCLFERYRGAVVNRRQGSRNANLNQSENNLQPPMRNRPAQPGFQSVVSHFFTLHDSSICNQAWVRRKSCTCAIE
jgi:hypothetical protein